MAELGEVIERLRAELAELKDRGAPVCEQYAWSSIRHVERNVDLDCCPEDDEHECDGWGRYSGTALAVLWNARTDILAALQAGQEYVEAKLDYDDICQRNGAAYHECGQIPEEWETDEGKAAERLANAEAALLAAHGKE